MPKKPTVLSVIVVLAVASAAACAKPRPPLVTRPSATGSTIVENVAVFDGVAGTTTPDRDVLLEHGRIARIAAAGTLGSAGASQRIDGTGATLLPGLIDMHGHAEAASGPPWIGGRPDALRNTADLVLVQGDPTREIGAVHRIRDVFLGGVRLERHPLPAASASR